MSILLWQLLNSNSNKNPWLATMQNTSSKYFEIFYHFAWKHKECWKMLKFEKNISDFSYFGAKQHFNKNEPKSQVLSLKYFCAISFITDKLLFRFVDILIKWHCNWCKTFKNRCFAFIYCKVQCPVNKLLSMPYAALKKELIWLKINATNCHF